MCAIAGIVATGEVNVALIREMNEIAAHRGPDGEGHFVEDNVALGHRRLAIVDLSDAGLQPMHYRQRYVLTFNGEIYNHRELRVELAQFGYDFKSQTDTEVIMSAYDRWGEDCLHHFNGMWAFALYDRKEQRLFCSRDRFGIKPFHYWVAPDTSLAFGSEIKQLTRHPLFRSKLNTQQAYEFLTFGITSHADETLFRGVFSLLPGHCFSVSTRRFSATPNSRIETRAWYRLKEEPFEGTYEDAKKAFRSRFVDSVALQLRADVEVGSCLSGGLDSSSVVCVVNELLSGKDAPDQKTYSICSSDAALDEREWIDHVVRKTGVKAEYAYPELGTLMAGMDRIIWHQEAPIAAAGVAMQWAVMELASSHGAKVLLDGQGSDEYLAGYPSFLGPFHLRLARRGLVFELCRELLACRRDGRSLGTSLVEMAKCALPTALRASLRTASLRPSWLNLDALQATPVHPYEQAGTGAGSIQDLSRVLLEKTNLPLLLHWEDRNSMAHSIESRVPFLDHRLVEFSLGLPDEFKVRNGATKAILRESMASLLPIEVAQRRDKKGFMAGEKSFLCQDRHGRFRKQVEFAVHASHGAIKPEVLTRLDEMVKGTRPYDQVPWRVASYGHWLKAYDVSV